MENGSREELAVADPEFRRLHEEHRHHEERLQLLAAKTRLSEDEEMEEKRLKKEKLLLKDRMEAIARTMVPVSVFNSPIVFLVGAGLVRGHPSARGRHAH